MKSVSRILRTGLTASSWLYLCSAWHNKILWKIPYNPNMKTEITVAILMLATGIVAIGLKSQPLAGNESPSNFAQVAAAPVPTRSVSNTPVQEATRIARSPSPDRNDDAVSNQDLIRNAARALNQSEPLKARLRYKINLFGEQISGPGHYFQKGQGTRLTRMQFEFGFEQSTVQIHQFCDGDKLYTMSVAGDKTHLEFVDLRKLEILQSETSTSSRVASWLSVGSLTGLLDQLAMHFDFDEVREGQLDNIPVLVCQGQWKPAALERLLEGQPAASAAKDGVVRWQQLPKHLPHRVTLTLGLDERFPYFPYRVVFEQFENEEGETIVNEISVLELFELKRVADLPDEMFTIPGIETVPNDSTEFYRQRIRQFTR